MQNRLRHWLHRLAPPSPIRDPLDHPDILRMTPHELDDLPLPRWSEKNSVPEIAASRK